MSDKKNPLDQIDNEDAQANPAEKTPTRRDFLKFAGAGAVAAGVAGLPTVLSAQKPKPGITTPTISCAPNGSDGKNVLDVTVCAPLGGTGLPAGFSIQWMKCADFEANGNQWFASDDPRLCKASFSGNASGTVYNLAAGACLTVHVGSFSIDNQQGYSATCETPLDCDTCYVFHAFGHATSKLGKSPFTPNSSCTTDACNLELPPPFSGCTKSIGYYRNQGSTNGTDQCALDFLGGSFNVGPTTYNSVAAIVAGVTAPNGSNTTRQGLGLQVAIALSDGGCANYCNCVTEDPDGVPNSGDEITTCGIYPAGFGAAVLCGIVDGVTPLTGVTYFPVGSAALLNGKTVQQVMDEVNSVLNGNAPTLGLTDGQLGDLCALLNLSYDGAGTGECCGATDFGLNHLSVGACA